MEFRRIYSTSRTTNHTSMVVALADDRVQYWRLARYKDISFSWISRACRSAWGFCKTSEEPLWKGPWSFKWKSCHASGTHYINEFATRDKWLYWPLVFASECVAFFPHCLQQSHYRSGLLVINHKLNERSRWGDVKVSLLQKICNDNHQTISLFARNLRSDAYILLKLNNRLFYNNARQV